MNANKMQKKKEYVSQRTSIPERFKKTFVSSMLEKERRTPGKSRSISSVAQWPGEAHCDGSGAHAYHTAWRMCSGDMTSSFCTPGRFGAAGA